MSSLEGQVSRNLYQVPKKRQVEMRERTSGKGAMCPQERVNNPREVRIKRLEKIGLVNPWLD